jgi:hypothetical protein
VKFAGFARIVLLALSGLFLFALGFGARRAIVEAQYRRIGPNLPFTLESALYYRRVKIVHDTGRLPTHDPMIQFPEGIDPRRTYTVGSEGVYARLARMFPASVPFSDRIRRLEAAWFSLSIPLLAWGVYRWRRSATAAWWSGAFYAVSLSSVMRSTGLELSHENFAMPFIAAHWALSVAAPEMRSGARRRCAEAAAAVALALALCAWDLVKFYVGLHLLARLWRVYRGREEGAAMWFEYVALCAVGVWNPYHAAHGWLTSNLMGLAHGIALLRLPVGWARRIGALPPALRAGAIAAVLAAALGAAALLHARVAPPEAYHHFAELLWAKIRHLNVKPADPSVLTFNQRILWTPALNSTDLRFALMMFPVLLALTFPALLLLWRTTRKLPDSRTGELVFAVCASLAAFWLFARFHVYLSLFACIAVGAAWTTITADRRLARGAAGLLAGGALFVEAAHTLRTPERWGRVNVYYRELNELTMWLERHAAPDPVLANFGVSGSIAAYGKCAVILHPKFESAAIRNRVRAYGEALFRGTEKEFRDWADAHGARYYVYAFGEFSREHPELQMRYFVNALDPAPDAAARGFEFDPDQRTWFVPLYRNVKYAVYRVVTAADEALAAREVARAEAAFQQGDLRAAERACLAAMEYFPRQPRALELLAMCGSLESAGFKAGGGAE